jgi:uncharacterized repeat protein (TIGR03803 family)
MKTHLVFHHKIGFSFPRLHSFPALVQTLGLFLLASPLSAQTCLPEQLKGSVLTSFNGGADAAASRQLVFREGSLYGVTSFGGASAAGTAFRLSPPVSPSTSWTRKTIRVFRGGTDGAFPSSGLLLDTNGAFYGGTYSGGASNLGTIYRLVPPKPPATTCIKQILYSFSGGADGSLPVGELVMDSSGALYGALNGGHGAIFKLSPPSSPANKWTNQILYTFLGGADGSMPANGLLLRSGELFGVTHDLGDTGRGTVYRLSPPVPPATNWTKTILHHFVAPAGSWLLSSGLVFDTAGALYGTTQQGGSFGNGMVYKLSPSIFSTWNFTNLYSFTGTPDAANPSSPPAFDSAGSLTGVTMGGGLSNAGAFYRLTPPTATGGSWSARILFNFNGPTGPTTPAYAPIMDTSGAIYGVAARGGRLNQGAVYRLTK